MPRLVRPYPFLKELVGSLRGVDIVVVHYHYALRILPITKRGNGYLKVVFYGKEPLSQGRDVKVFKGANFVSVSSRNARKLGAFRRSLNSWAKQAKVKIKWSR